MKDKSWFEYWLFKTICVVFHHKYLAGPLKYQYPNMTRKELRKDQFIHCMYCGNSFRKYGR